MDHMSLNDELRKQLIESAAWGKAGITPRIDETVETEEVVEEGTTKGKRRKTARRAYEKPEVAQEVAHTEHEDAEGAEELEEAVHVCPLCTSILDESIDEERILEHLDVVLGLVDRLSQLQEGDEDIDQVIDQTLQELLLGSEEEEE